MRALTFISGFFAGVSISLLARKRWVEYVSKRKRWSESEVPSRVVPQNTIETLNHQPAGSATVISGYGRPRKRPV